MKRLWLVLNTASGSTTAAIITEFETACADYQIAGRSDFPAQSVPTIAHLQEANIDTLVVFGGDGTINAATCSIDDWGGTCLVLPGGTMNGLAKALHGDATWSEILERAPTAATVQVPLAEADGHRAMVGVILGPASAWFHARERVRSAAFARLGRALRFAARKTFARTIRVVGDAKHEGRHRAVIITPLAELLEVASISSGSWFAAAKLGVQWLLGDWRQASDVSVSHVTSVELASKQTVSALFDGEPVRLPSPVRVVHALTKLLLHRHETDVTVRLFHVSDLHFGTEDRAALAWFAGLVAAEAPDAVIMTGDLTAAARRREFAAAQAWLVALGVPVTVELGNHDMPVWNLWERFTDPTRRYDRLERAVERTLVLPGVSIVPLRTATRAQWRRNWAEGVVRPHRLADTVNTLAQTPPGNFRLVACHHPLAGEGRRHRTRGGIEALRALAAAGAHAVLSGHTHDAFDIVSPEGVRLIGAGTLSERLRKTRPSFNELTIDGGRLEVVARTME